MQPADVAQPPSPPPQALETFIWRWQGCLENLRQPEIRERLVKLWTEPLSL